MPKKETALPIEYKLLVERIIQKYENTIQLSSEAIANLPYPTSDMANNERYAVLKYMKEDAEVMLEMIHKYIKP